MTVHFILQYRNFQNLSEETNKVIHDIRFCIFFLKFKNLLLKFIIGNVLRMVNEKNEPYDKE